jgi:hypothetical protein
MKKLVLLAALVSLSAQAAAPQPERVRGTIQSFDGQTLAVAVAGHGVVKLAVSQSTGINGLEKKTVKDIHDNTFIGTTAVKAANGRWQATEVHIFPEAMRGAGEGHYAWDTPNSTMTNAAVTGVAGKRNGRTLHLKYATNQGAGPGGEVEVEITKKTAIVAFTAGDRTLFVPGARVFALAVPQSDDTAAAVAIVVETRGVKPPM